MTSTTVKTNGQYPHMLPTGRRVMSRIWFLCSLVIRAPRSWLTIKLALPRRQSATISGIRRSQQRGAAGSQVCRRGTLRTAPKVILLAGCSFSDRLARSLCPWADAGGRRRTRKAVNGCLPILPVSDGFSARNGTGAESIRRAGVRSGAIAEREWSGARLNRMESGAKQVTKSAVCDVSAG